MMKKNCSIFFGLILSFLVVVPQAFAAQTTMVVTPQNGSFDKAFAVSVVIDGHGDVFNAAESTVALSSNLQVEQVTLGDCNFSYLTTPTDKDLSFSGVILSGSSKKCTVYKATLLPKAKGNGTVTLSKGTVRRYGDAVNVLSKSTNATFTLTGIASGKVSEQAKKNTDGLYTVSINVLAKEGEPLQDATVQLTSPAEQTLLEKKTATDGKAQFAEIKEGIYQATVKKDNKEVAKTIVNVKGANSNLNFGINLENQKNNPLLGQTTINLLNLPPIYLVGILILGILLGTGIAVFIMKRTKRS